MKTYYLQLFFCLMFINLSCVESNSQSNDSANTSSMTANSPWSTITAGNQCGVEDAKKVVVKTQEEFDSLWQQCFQNMPEPVAKPKIDFTKEWVLGVFLGSTNQGGHSLTLDDIRSSEGVSKVTLTHSKPGKDCMGTMSIDFPYILARIAHFTTGKMDYEVVEKVVDCK